MKIALLLSGGVDSSVALALLKDAGHDVTAFYLKIWLEDELAYLGNCPWEEDLAYAQKTCAQLAVPLEVVPLQKDYWQRVVTYTVSAVEEGLTPNPDMLCNREIKFGIFCEKFGTQFKKIATGHYAQTEIINDRAVLTSAPDQVKDQTYFLAMLSQAQLRKALFPIGHLAKTDVRALAKKYDLPTQDRKDSQGICFLGQISFADFIKHHLGEKSGDVIEKETGKVLGQHNGFYFHTIGQRRGLNLPGGPWYVCDKDPRKNIVYVSHGFAGEDQRRDTFIVGQLNWIAGPPTKKQVRVKLRHGPHFYDCVIDTTAHDTVHVQLAEKDQGVTPGQFAVFYDGDHCLGGGVIM